MLLWLRGQNYGWKAHFLNGQVFVSLSKWQEVAKMMPGTGRIVWYENCLCCSDSDQRSKHEVDLKMQVAVQSLTPTTEALWLKITKWKVGTCQYSNQYRCVSFVWKENQEKNPAKFYGCPLSSGSIEAFSEKTFTEFLGWSVLKFWSLLYFCSTIIKSYHWRGNWRCLYIKLFPLEYLALRKSRYWLLTSNWALRGKQTFNCLNKDTVSIVDVGMLSVRTSAVSFAIEKKVHWWNYFISSKIEFQKLKAAK